MVKPLPTQDEFLNSTITVVADNGEGGVEIYNSVHQCSGIDDNMIGFYRNKALIMIPLIRVIRVTYKFKKEGAIS